MTSFVGINQVRLSQPPMSQKALDTHTRRVYAELKQLGAVRYNMLLPETHELPKIIHPDEHLRGIVYGRYRQNSRFSKDPNASYVGRGALIVTSQRILFLDKKPFFMRCEEILPFIISGVTYSKVLGSGIITLHTRAGDFSIRTLNSRCAQSFVEAIETLSFQNTT